MRFASIAARSAIFLAGVYITYATLMNLAISTHALEAVINKLAPSHVHVHYRSAYSLWPMRVHTKNFEVRTTDSAVEVWLRMDEATTTFSLVDFFGRRVHMHNAQAKGVSLRLRFKIDPSEATPDYVAKLPPIDGFSDPPLKPAVIPPDLDDAHYNLWTVQLDDVVADDVREVWADTVRVADARGGSLAGGFFLKPMRVARVDPTTFKMLDATIATGKEEIATEIEGTFELVLRALDMRNASSNDAIHLVDLNVHARAKTGDLQFLNPALAKQNIVLAGGEGALHMVLGVERGVLVPQSHLEMRTSQWHGSRKSEHVSGSTFVHAYVTDHVQASLEMFGLDLHHGKTSVVHADYVGVATRVDDLDLTELGDRWAASIDAPKARIEDLKALSAYTEMPFQSGSATVNAHADIDPHNAKGHAKVVFANTSIKLPNASALGNGKADITLGHYDRDHDRGQMSNVKLDLDEVAYDKSRGWWAHLATGPFAFTTKNEVSADVTLTGQCRDALVPLAILGAPGIVSTIVGHQPLTVMTHAVVSPSSMNASDIRIIGDSIELYAHYRADAHDKNGAGIAITNLANVGFEIQHGSLSVRPLASRSWYDRTRPDATTTHDVGATSVSPLVRRSR